VLSFANGDATHKNRQTLKSKETSSMCGRFGASFQYRDIKIVWNLYGDFPGYFPRYNIAPSQEVPVIVRNDNRNELRQMRWGRCRRGRRTLRWGSA
jgi:hypothetical protein